MRPFAAAPFFQQGLTSMATNRYDSRRDPLGWTVFDRWTGRPVVLLHCKQSGMTWIEAEDLIGRLGRRAEAGDRSILQ